MAINKKGMMFVLSSPSGAGKTTLTKKLVENNPDFAISVSHTTRKPRTNEIDGKDYHFITNKEFDYLIKKNNFYEFAKIFDNFYGTHKEKVIKLLFSTNRPLLNSFNHLVPGILLLTQNSPTWRDSSRILENPSYLDIMIDIS